jgi:hypothetical protein
MKFLEIDMNKKHFLLLLPFCLLFCLWFTTCEEPEVTNLWDKLRNTVWTKTDTITEGNGDKWETTCTIGFYGSNYGPRPTYSPIPYAVIRRYATGKTPDWWEAEVPYFNFYDLQINRTGNTISTERYGKSFSFRISVSGDLEKLTILNKEDLGYESGKYTRIDTKFYNWNYNGSGWMPIDPDFEENFFGEYTATWNSNSEPITEGIFIKDSILSFYDKRNPNEHLYFSSHAWELAVTPNIYSSKYPNAFKITGIITEASPQQDGDNPYLYGNKTASGFTSDDINSTECWIYLYFDDDGEELIRTGFSKTGNLNEDVITITDNMPRVYRR